MYRDNNQDNHLLVLSEGEDEEEDDKDLKSVLARTRGQVLMV